MKKTKIGFIGCGNMSTAIVSGLYTNKDNTFEVYVAETNNNQSDHLKKHYVNIHISNHFKYFIDDADIIILGVKPQTLPELLPELGTYINNNQLIISVAAGVTADTIQKGLKHDRMPVIRAMPNMAASVGQSATALFANDYCTDEHKHQAQEILKACGTAVWLEQESLISAVVAVSGSSPAYFFFLLEVMEKIGVSLGLSQELSNILTKQAILGSAQLAFSSKDSFASLKEQICSPQGTTEQAIKSLKKDDFEGMVQRAMIAAFNRDQTLAEEISHNITGD